MGVVPAPAPLGDCVPNGPAYYAAACSALASTCEQYSFCKRVMPGSSTQPIPSPGGACVSNDPHIDYSAACKALEATCEQFSFCRRTLSLTQSSTMLSAPVRRLQRLRRSKDHALIQQGNAMQRKSASEEKLDGLKYTTEDHLDFVTPQAASTSRSEL